MSIWIKKSFKIYYDDKSIYKGIGNNSLDALGYVPRFGVIAIAQEDYHRGREVLESFDFYYLKDRWYGCDWMGLIDQILHNLEEIHLVVVGRMVSKELYQKIVAMACDDPGLPKMSAK